jgi:hypothetical protein
MANLNWGDVPTWIGSVITSVSVLVAAISYRRSVIDKERNQASKVGAWFVKTDESRRAACITNASVAPIYEIELLEPPMPNVQSPILPAGGAAIIELLEESDKDPGGPQVVRIIDRAEEGILTREIWESEQQPTIQFRDAVGRWWKRDSAGRLLKRTGRTTRYTVKTRSGAILREDG